jgi:CDP-diacylglycerol--glycerol-3-phosphate 3-phosphatidyltransferase
MLDGRWRATVERGLEPVGVGLHRAGVTADGLTIIGLVFAVATAFLIAGGHLLLGVFGVILTGLPDILDGSVARTSGRAGPRGAFFDSVCDRVADAAIFCGLAWYLSNQDPKLPVLVLAVVALSMLITYERARAESLGFQARGGLMERAERLVLLGIGLAFDVLVPMLWVMLALTAVTAVQRFVKVWRQATPARPRRVRHLRGPGTDEPRAGSLAQWWAAHRPQTDKTSAKQTESQKPAPPNPAAQKPAAQKTGGPGAPRRR